MAAGSWKEASRAETIDLLLEKGADVNARTASGRTALHYAADEGDTKAAGLLIAKGVQINAKDNEGKTALALAQARGRKDIVELLLKNGAENNNVDSQTTDLK
jgi:ankyrin repeat protein